MKIKDDAIVMDAENSDWMHTLSGYQSERDIIRKAFGMVSTKGGPGSGNFGHEGRPGLVGGSVVHVITETDTETARLLVSQGLEPSFKRKGEVSEYAPGMGVSREGTYVSYPNAFSRGSFGPVRLHLRIHPDDLSVSPEMADLGHKGAEGVENSLKTENGAITNKYIPPEAIESVETYESGKWQSHTPEEFLSKEGKIPRLPTVGEYEARIRAMAKTLMIPERKIPEQIETYRGMNLEDKLAEAESLGMIKTTKGGPGSGNFGHEGRPGLVGGSGKGGTARGEDDKMPKTHALFKDVGPFDPMDQEAEKKAYAKIDAIAKHIISSSGLDTSRKEVENWLKPYWDETKDIKDFTWETDILLRYNRDLNHGIEGKLKEAIAMGNFDPEKAEDLDLGWNEAIHPQGATWAPLPKELYHTTTNAQAIIAEGLKSKAERGTSGVGLGGGEDDVVCFSSSADYCKSIERALDERWLYMRGVIGSEDLMTYAEKGYGGVGHDWSDKFREYCKDLGGYDNAIEEIKTQTHSPSWSWDERKTVRLPLSADDLLHRKASLYNSYLWAKQQAGGYENPMFMFSDEKAFAGLDPTQFKTVRVRSKVKAMGYYMGDAEHEWRTAGGKTVKIAGVVDNGFDIENYLDTIVK